jgi:hypothetical protein
MSTTVVVGDSFDYLLHQFWYGDQATELDWPPCRPVEVVVSCFWIYEMNSLDNDVVETSVVDRRVSGLILPRVPWATEHQV